LDINYGLAWTRDRTEWIRGMRGTVSALTFRLGVAGRKKAPRHIWRHLALSSGSDGSIQGESGWRFLERARVVINGSLRTRVIQFILTGHQDHEPYRNRRWGDYNKHATGKEYDILVGCLSPRRRKQNVGNPRFQSRRSMVVECEQATGQAALSGQSDLCSSVSPMRFPCILTKADSSTGAPWPQTVPAAHLDNYNGGSLVCSHPMRGTIGRTTPGLEVVQCGRAVGQHCGWLRPKEPTARLIIEGRERLSVTGMFGIRWTAETRPNAKYQGGEPES